MPKPTPNPPNPDLSAPAQSTDQEKLEETIKLALDFYANPAAHIALINATPRQLHSMFSVNPELDVQTLLSHACESLASANVMAMDLADHMEGTRRNSLLGIAQVIMLGELAVNQALDKLDAAE